MRKFIVLFPLLLVLIFVGCSKKKVSNSNVPDVVSQALTSKFPQAKSITWKKVNEFEYHASFISNGKKMMASLSDDGDLLSTKKEISMNNIPKGVLSTVTRQYKKSSIKDAYKITNKKGTQYEVDISKNGKVTSMTFDDDGDLIQQS
ncbi:MAG TPA: PepSY-like domain-containing protein [Balneolales bacterium]|nr:PepSY-like domain-containing protein [Balneolales bacterium]